MACNDDGCRVQSYVAETPPPRKPFSDQDALAISRGSPEFENKFDLEESVAWKPFSDQDELAMSAVSLELENKLDLEANLSPQQYGQMDSTRSSMRCSSQVNILQAARSQGRWRLLRLRGPTLLVGPLSLFGGLWLGLVRKSSYRKQYIVFSITSSLCLCVGALALAMSLLPSDRRCVPLALLFVGCPSCLFYVATHSLSFANDFRMISSGRCSFNGMPRSCSFTVAFTASGSAVAIAALIGFTVLLVAVKKTQDTESKLKIFWKTISALALVTGLSSACRCFASCSLEEYFEGVGFAINSFVFFACCGFSLRYTLICMFQSWLMSRGEAATAAAGIAELLGGQEPMHVLAEARNTFASVTADKLTEHAMRFNNADASLSALALRTSLGHIDAFVSHSWHDDPDMKWYELQMWCMEFRKMHRREPRRWIDKYCIDQNNLDKSLACLPIYISGCRTFLILCGKTYLKRLWCLIEIFAFLEMGGDSDNLEVRLLKQSDDTLCQTSSLFSEIGSFDSMNALCTNQEDTTRLRRVIQMAGSGKFNSLVSDAFARKVVK